MHNELFSIGPFTVYGYGLMIAIGMILAVWLGMRRCPARGLDKDQMFNLGFSGILAGVVGAKLLFYIVELPSVIEDPSMLLDFTNGFVVYGGIFTGILIPYIYCRVKKLPFLQYLDTAIPSIPLAQGFGRIGCFLAGCCYGLPTDSVIGVVFPAESMAPSGIALIPTQLISSVGDFAIAAFLLWYTRKGAKREPGMAAGWYMILYGVGRFVIEFFRGDHRGTVGFLSTSQFISILLLIFAIFWMARCRKRKQERLQAEIDAKVDAELQAEEEEKREKEKEWQRVGQAFQLHESTDESLEESVEEEKEEVEEPENPEGTEK